MDNAAMANNSATSKVEYLDYNKLTDDVNVNVAYLGKNEDKRIVKDDIKTFQNKLTEVTRRRQRKLNFVEFPKAR